MVRALKCGLISLQIQQFVDLMGKDTKICWLACLICFAHFSNCQIVFTDTHAAEESHLKQIAADFRAHIQSRIEAAQGSNPANRLLYHEDIEKNQFCDSACSSGKCQTCFCKGNTCEICNSEEFCFIADLKTLAIQACAGCACLQCKDLQELTNRKCSGDLTLKQDCNIKDPRNNICKNLCDNEEKCLGCKCKGDSCRLCFEDIEECTTCNNSFDCVMCSGCICVKSNFLLRDPKDFVVMWNPSC